jgi:hypothetical protein
MISSSVFLASAPKSTVRCQRKIAHGVWGLELSACTPSTPIDTRPELRDFLICRLNQRLFQALTLGDVEAHESRGLYRWL